MLIINSNQLMNSVASVAVHGGSGDVRSLLHSCHTQVPPPSGHVLCRRHRKKIGQKRFDSLPGRRGGGSAGRMGKEIQVIQEFPSIKETCPTG